MVLFSKSRFYWIWLVVTFVMSWMTLTNIRIYFLEDVTPIFLFEKGSLRHWAVWRTALYFHIVGAGLCLATGLPLMFKQLLRFKLLHRVLGYIYFNSVLWVAAPAGLIMAPFAKGGFWGAAGFILTGVPWWVTTWLGYRAIRRREIEQHVRWMIRSFSLALSAIWFRLIQYSLFHCGMEDQSNYLLSLWLSLGVSLFTAEMCIVRRSGRSATSAVRFFVVSNST